MHDPVSYTSFSLLHSQSYLEEEEEEEEEASMFLHNTCTYPQKYFMAPHPQEVYSHCSLL
jgi:hypothetical protein